MNAYDTVRKFINLLQVPLGYTITALEKCQPEDYDIDYGLASELESPIYHLENSNDLLIPFEDEEKHLALPSNYLKHTETEVKSTTKSQSLKSLKSSHWYDYEYDYSAKQYQSSKAGTLFDISDWREVLFNYGS